MDRAREIYRSEKKCQKVMNKHYIIGFWITLGISIGLLVGGALTPPMFIIDGSIFKAVGLLFLWPTLAFGAKAVEDGRVAKLVLGNAHIQIGKDEDGNGLDDDFEAENKEIDEFKDDPYPDE